MEVLEGEIVPVAQESNPVALDLYQQLPLDVQKTPGVLERVRSLDAGQLERLASHYQLSVGCNTYSIQPHIAPTFQPSFTPHVEVKPVIMIDANSLASNQQSGEGWGQYWWAAAFVAILLALAMPGGD
jgi:hypothetical protein